MQAPRTRLRAKAESRAHGAHLACLLDTLDRTSAGDQTGTLLDILRSLRGNIQFLSM